MTFKEDLFASEHDFNVSPAKGLPCVDVDTAAEQ